MKDTLDMATQKKDLTPLSNVIDTLMSDGTLPFDPDDAAIYRVWDDVVASVRPDLVGSCTPFRIKQKRLQVTVAHPILLQELRPSEKPIREGLNRTLKRTAVIKIDFRVG